MSAKDENIRVWDSSNIAESFPGIVMPLTYSIARRGYELVYKSQGYESGLSWYQLEANHRALNSMVGIFAGRMYYNLLNWYIFIGLFPSNSKNQKYLDEQLQTIGEAVYRQPTQYPLSYRFKFMIRISRRALLFERERKNYWKYLETVFNDYKNMSQEKDIVKLLNRYSLLEQKAVPHMGRAVDNDYFVMTYNGAIKKRLKRWLGEKSASHNNFLGSLHDVISARQATLLIEIADNINQDKHALELIAKSRYKTLDKYLTKTSTYSLLVEYRTKFLHRFAEDQKIEATNPLLEIEGFYSLIKTYTKLDITSKNKKHLEILESEKIRSQEILNQLNLIQKLTYRFLLKRLKHHLRIREQNRLLRGKIYALLRELFIEFGEVLADQKIIKLPRDIYYLDIEELFQLIDGSGYSDDLQDLIENRKDKYRSYNHIQAPSRFITKGIITDLPSVFSVAPKDENRTLKTHIDGTIVSPGNVEGRVTVLHEPIMPTEPFDILVVSHTDPGWTPLIALAKGIIVENGGILSHAAIVTRELGIPSIIGVEDATKQLKDDMLVRINSNKSHVEILGK